MTLLDRYLDAVRMFLPKDVRQTDVIEEIGNSSNRGWKNTAPPLSGQ